MLISHYHRIMQNYISIGNRNICHPWKSQAGWRNQTNNQSINHVQVAQNVSHKLFSVSLPNI